MIKLGPAEILYLVGAFHGLFLAVMMLIRKKSLRTNLFLALLILLFSFYLFENVIWSSGYLRMLPHLFLVTLPLTFLIGPLFYTYIRSNVFSNFRLKSADLLHLLPFVFEVTVLWQFYMLDAPIKVRIYDATVNSQQPGEFNIYFLAYVIYIISTGWYFYKSFRLLADVDTINDPRNKPKRQWLQRASVVFFTYLVVSLVLSFATMFWPATRPFAFHFNLTLQLLLIHATGYVAFIYPDLFLPLGDEAKKYRSSPLDSQTMADLKSKLVGIIEQHRPYLDSDVTPEYFLDKLGVSKHHFSQLLTVGMQTTFYDLINSYRIEAAKAMLLSERYENAKILHVAYDCGFSNKSSFLRNFKKLTGATPTEFKGAATKLGSTPLKDTAGAPR